MANNIYTGKEATDKLISGINVIADAVKLTLGAKGKNAILEQLYYPNHIITNDGISIAALAQFDDPIEQMGANLIKEVSDRTNKQSGDGTTTSIVLTQAIIKEAQALGYSGIEVKNSLNEILPRVIEMIDEQKKDIKISEVAAVANISAENETLGAVIQEIYEQIGRNGIITLDTNPSGTTSYTIVPGVRYHGARLLSPYFVTEGFEAIKERPNIMLVEEKITSVEQLKPMIRGLAERGKNSFVLIADEIHPAVFSSMVKSHQKGDLDIAVIIAPTVMKDTFYEDVALLTGATIVGEHRGLPFKDFKTEHFGTCDKIITGREDTIFIGTNDVSGHIEELKKNTDPISEKRAQILNTQTAILSLSAQTEVELSYLRLKAEDAVNAARLALEDGVVAGGGVVLANISIALSDNRDTASKILSSAFLYPIRQIINNCGLSEDTELIEFVRDRGISDTGFNAKTSRLVNMFDSNIIDPALVTKNAVRNAISVAGTVLTTEIAITLPKQKEQPKMPGLPE